MRKWIDYLSANRVLNVTLFMMYFFTVVLPHEKVGLIIDEFFSKYSRDLYNQIILLASIGLLVIVLLSLLKSIWNLQDRKRIFFFWALTIFFIFIVNSYLFVANIESVHYVQYAIFAFILFPLFSNYYSTLFWGTFVGVLDEAYQYFILAPERTDYYDFNDIITNFLGVCVGLLILKSLEIKEKNPSVNYERKAILPYLFTYSIILFGLLLSPILSVYPSEESFQLIKVMPVDFWSEIVRVAVYHIVLPVEGAFILLSLFVVYYFGFHDFQSRIRKET